jgi:hypothetical protein
MNLNAIGFRGQKIVDRAVAIILILTGAGIIAGQII